MSSAAQIADRLEAALVRVECLAAEQCRRTETAERRATLLEQHGANAVAALDALLEAAR